MRLKRRTSESTRADFAAGGQIARSLRGSAQRPSHRRPERTVLGGDRSGRASPAAAGTFRERVDPARNSLVLSTVADECAISPRLRTRSNPWIFWVTPLDARRMLLPHLSPGSLASLGASHPNSDASETGCDLATYRSCECLRISSSISPAVGFAGQRRPVGLPWRHAQALTIGGARSASLVTP